MQIMYKDSVMEVINNQVKKIWSVFNLEPNFDIRKLIENLGGVIGPDMEDRLTDYEEAEIIEDGKDVLFRIVYNHRVICTEEEKTEISKNNITNDTIDKHLRNPLVRCAVAHEIGHLFLHMIKQQDGELLIEGDYKRNIKDSSLIEWEAETFATIFLMPEQVFRIHYERLELIYGEFQKKIDEMAKIFGVSYSEIIKRGRQLKLWT